MFHRADPRKQSAIEFAQEAPLQENETPDFDRFFLFAAKPEQPSMLVFQIA
jgi:hypothetical protein